VPALLPLWLASGLAGFVVIVLVGITLFFPLADHQQYRGPMQALPQPPRLEVAPGTDLKTYRAAKRHELTVPQRSIGDAMRATAAQGWGPPR
jgi:hypothetical protein